MLIQDKIRTLREINQWTQDEMAEKMGMSKNGYAKIERGETKLYIDKLQKIAQVFNINVAELLDEENNKDIFICINGDNSNHSHSNIKYSGNAELNHEIEKLNLIIQHKDELITRLQSELDTLKQVLNTIQSRP